MSAAALAAGDGTRGLSSSAVARPALQQGRGPGPVPYQVSESERVEEKVWTLVEDTTIFMGWRSTYRQPFLIWPRDG